MAQQEAALFTLPNSSGCLLSHMHENIQTQTPTKILWEGHLRMNANHVFKSTYLYT